MDQQLRAGQREIAARLAVPGLAGRWERSLLRTAGGRVDPAAGAVWLQGPSLFVDLRMAAGLPAEGFAGEFTQSGQVFEWRHEIDLVPRAAPDTGTLHWEGERLVELGVHEDYAEHWHRAPAPAGPCWGLRLAGRGGRRAILVRVGADAGWACGPGPGPAEVSLARIRGGVAWVTHASNPARAGARLFWSVTPTTATVAAAGADGVTRSRWHIVHREGPAA
jgi:hypothetical protein